MEGGGSFQLINKGGCNTNHLLSAVFGIPPKPLRALVFKIYIYINKIIVMILNKKMSVTKYKCPKKSLKASDMMSATSESFSYTLSHSKSSKQT